MLFRIKNVTFSTENIYKITNVFDPNNDVDFEVIRSVDDETRNHQLCPLFAIFMFNVEKPVIVAVPYIADKTKTEKQQYNIAMNTAIQAQRKLCEIWGKGQSDIESII